MSSNSHFSVTWDRGTYIMTIIFLSVLLGTGVVLFSVRKDLDPPGIAWILLLVIHMPVLLSVWLLAPREYEISENSLIIRRVGKNVRIPCAEISEIQIMSGREVFRKAIRLCASGGAFGYFGAFTSASLGSFTAYVGRTSGDLVIIKRGRKEPVVVSPDDAGRFVEMLGNEIKK